LKIRKSTTAVITVFLAIHMALSFSVAFAGNENINTTKTENMTNTTTNITMPQNCIALRNCVENYTEIQNCTIFKNCTQNYNMPPMRVTFETIGGFGGLTTTKAIDSEKLPAEQANRLRQLVDTSDFFNLSATIVYSGPARDFFQYKLTVESEGKKHTIAVDEPAAPPELKPLIQLLRTIKSPE
jgi:hypothetical protein